jgi:superfamily II DNA/RNA helicase
VPLRYFVADIPDLAKVNVKSTGDYREDELEKIMEGLAPLVDSYLEHCPGKCGVVFAVTIEHSLQIVEQYRRAGIRAEHLDGDTPDAERKRIIRDFKEGRITVIVNVGIITEGFDFPACEFIQLARPTKSLGLFLQMVGRVTRAEAGCVDVPGYTAEQRRRAIAASGKPCGIVLDNAGCWLEHGLPTDERDIEYYFKGAKKAKKKVEETIEILVYVAEDGEGNRKRLKRPEELVGMRLVEVTVETERKVAAIAKLRDFDRMYEAIKYRAPGKKVGYVSFYEFIKACEAKGTIITDAMWEYMMQRLVWDVEDKLTALDRARRANFEQYPDELYSRLTTAAKLEGVSKEFFKKQRSEYEKKHFAATLSQRFS